MPDKMWTINRISLIDACEKAFETGFQVFVNEQYIIEWSTPNVNRLFGYTPGELNGKRLGDLIPPEKREVHHEHFKNFFRNPVDRNMGVNLKQSVFDGYKKDGTLIRVSILINAAAVDGKVIAIGTIFPVIEIK